MKIIDFFCVFLKLAVFSYEGAFERGFEKNNFIDKILKLLSIKLSDIMIFVPFFFIDP